MDKVIFRCAICKVALSEPLAELQERKKPCYDLEYVPRGYFVIADEEFGRASIGHHVINLQDARNTAHYPDQRGLFGCCGPSGFDGVNTVCINGHGIGTEHSDCHVMQGLELEPGCAEIERLSINEEMEH